MIRYYALFNVTLGAFYMTILYTTKQAAEFLNFKVQTIEQWRAQGKGPKYAKLGKEVRYKLGDLETYLEENSIDPSDNNRAI